MKELNPIQNLFSDFEKILNFIRLKNKASADSFETVENKINIELWMKAKTQDDTYLTYLPYWTFSMFQKVLPNIRHLDFKKWKEKPFQVPLLFRETLRTEGRKAFLEEYEEKNDYYRMLMGIPPLGSDEDDFLYLSNNLALEFGVSQKIPIHKLPNSIQNEFLKTDEYKQLLDDNPKANYLRYIGKNRIDNFVARRAKDFEIIRYPDDQYNINPYLLSEFKRLYNQYRDYIMGNLYNPVFENSYPNYRHFMGLLIMFYTLLQLSNSCTEALNNNTFLDDSAIYLIFSLYGIPENVTLNSSVRRKIVQSIHKLIQNKGTSDIFYNLIEILGYKNTEINQLLLMKGQVFENNQATSNYNPYFLELNLSDQNPYKTIQNNQAKKYSYKEIVSLDEEWIDDQEVQSIIHNRNYSVSNSKFLTISSQISQFDYLAESIFLLRFLLDTKNLTANEMIQIPDLFGNEEFSIYDTVVALIAAVCKNSKIKGIIDVNHKPIPVAGFNFNLDSDLITDYINNSKYLEKDKIKLFLDNIYAENVIDLNRVYNDIIIPVRDWLKYKISIALNKEEFLEYENIYKALFTVDIDKTKIFNDYKTPIETIKQKYSISDQDFQAFQLFYPHFTNGKTAEAQNIYQTQYRTPFLDYNHQVTWFIPIQIETLSGTDNRGNLYFYDLLNSENSMEITNSSNLRIFMDYENDNWVINQKAVEKAIEEINKLNDNELVKAYFQVRTIANETIFKKGQALPDSIRNPRIFKEILIQKLQMDSLGLSSPPETFIEHLYSRNQTLFNFVESELFETNHQVWLEGLTKIVLALETNLNLYLKFFEESIIGTELFFKPLITLINHFKSTFVKLIKTNFIYLIDEKVDSGGNSAMLKFFENIKMTLYFVILAKKGYHSQFGFFDTEKSSKRKIVFSDWKSFLKGGIPFQEELKFFKNGNEVDPSNKPSLWFIGESDQGRWSDENDFIYKTRNSKERAINAYKFDFESWKNFVESYIH